MDRPKTAAALALAGLAGHAFFLPLSIAGMQIGLAVAAAGVLLSPPRPLRTPLDVPALVFVGIAILSDLLAPSGPPAFAAATLWRAVLGFIVVAHALRIAPPRTPWRLLVCLSAGLLCASVVGLLQYRTGFDLVHALGLRSAPALVQAPGVEGRYGAMGFFTSRLTFGHNATLVVATLAGALVSGAVPAGVRIAFGATCALGLAAVAVTFGRAAYLGVVVAVAVLIIRGGRRRLAFALAAAAALAAPVHPGGNGSARARRGLLAADRRDPHGVAEHEPVRAGRAGGSRRLVHHRPGPRRALRHQGHVRAVVLASASDVARTAAGHICRMIRSIDVRKTQPSGCGCRT
ncbi:MAG: hypothetical protein E6J84_14350 [Deltaproteobacteria bacterium]|nr:MAG: hypothetical protein E6J84_14350 [Deltaproteobacteria bacterium]